MVKGIENRLAAYWPWMMARANREGLTASRWNPSQDFPEGALLSRKMNVSGWDEDKTLMGMHSLFADHIERNSVGGKMLVKFYGLGRKCSVEMAHY
jgi:hypothetical protein